MCVDNTVNQENFNLKISAIKISMQHIFVASIIDQKNFDGITLLCIHDLLF